MAGPMTIPDSDADRLALLEAMAAELEAYLDADELTRLVVVHTPGRTYRPNMTLGLLLDLRVAVERSLAQLGMPERDRFEQAAETIESVRRRRSDDYGVKLRRELKSQLDSWTWYVDGLEHGDEGTVASYPSEVWIRTRISDLLDEARGVDLDTSAEAQRVLALDRRLDEMFEAGPYVGPAGEKGVRPPDRYWWLYGRPGTH